MTHLQLEQINANCLSFLEFHFHEAPEHIAYWAKYSGRFTKLTCIRVMALAADLSIEFSDLVLKHGFGSEVITIDQMQQAIKEESAGYCLDKVMVAA